jgi:hypothetical protein
VPVPKRKSHAKLSSKQSPLLPPATTPNTVVNREEWLDAVSKGFVATGESLRFIYRIILETLWPDGHGIPGPIIDRTDIRAAIDSAKGMAYKDPFRRVRELQGDEGFKGIHQQGTKYQLVSLNVSQKKQPRTYLPDKKWAKVVSHYDGVCAVCGSPPGDEGFQQDHKIPRDRGGTDDLENWQPLCDTCNNLKSSACRGCTEECSKCCWAFPEYYKPLKIPGPVVQLVRQYAEKNGVDPDQAVINWILEKVE